MSSKLHFDAVFQKYSIVLSKFEAASQYCQVNDREKYMHDIKTGLDEIEMCDHVNISTQERNKISIGYYYRVIRVLRDMDSKCDGCGERNRFFCLYWNENKEEPNDNQMKCDRQLWFEHACYLIQTSLRWNPHNVGSLIYFGYFFVKYEREYDMGISYLNQGLEIDAENTFGLRLFSLRWLSIAEYEQKYNLLYRWDLVSKTERYRKVRIYVNENRFRLCAGILWFCLVCLFCIVLLPFV
eukprot:196392_1